MRATQTAEGMEGENNFLSKENGVYNYRIEE